MAGFLPESLLSEGSGLGIVVRLVGLLVGRHVGLFQRGFWEPVASEKPIQVFLEPLIAHVFVHVHPEDAAIADVGAAGSRLVSLLDVLTEGWLMSPLFDEVFSLAEPPSYE